MSLNTSIHGWLPRDANRVLVLMNPKAGAHSGAPLVGRLRDLLGERGFTVDVLTEPDRMAEEAVRCHDEGTLRAVVAAGGDGTAQLVVSRTPPGVPIAVLPLGTENLLAKHLRLSASADCICQAICQGHTIRLDAGQCQDRLFLLMVSCGFDADVVRRLHEQRRGHIHQLSYAVPILKSLLRYEYPEIRVYCQGQKPNGERLERKIASHWAFVFNLPCYAVGLGIVPDADGSDGMLDICAFYGGSWWHSLIHFGNVVLGRHRQRSTCDTLRATSIRIEADGKVPYQLDGDPGGFLPVQIDILPQRVTLVVPTRTNEHDDAPSC